MKFSSTFVLAVLPLFSQFVSAQPVVDGGLAARAQQQQQNQRNRGGAAAAAAAAQKQKQAQAAAAAKAKAAQAAAAAKNNKNKGGKVVGNGTAAASTAAAAGAAQSSAAAAAGGAANNAGAGAAAGGAAAGTGGAAANTGDPQTSLTLDPKVICPGFAQDGQANATAGQVPSRTSTNNFINNCLNFPNLPLTDGKQIQTGSCNPAPIGVIPDVDHMPSSKFVFPPNLGTVTANQAFTVKMAINNLNAGHFTNAQTNYFAAPQDVDGSGTIIGHTHVTIESIPALDSTTPTNPKNFIFFKGINTGAVGGVVTADVTAGLPAGTYRMCSINTNSNHAPVIVPVAQHGALDDCTYFSSTANGQAAAGAGAAAGGAAAGAAAGGAAANTATAAAASTATAAAAAGNNKGAAAAGTAAAGTAAAGNAKGAAAANNNKGAAATAANNKAAAAKAAQQAQQAKAAQQAKGAQQAKQAKNRGGRR